MRQPDREESDAATNQGTPGPPAAGRDQEGPSHVSFRGGGPCQHLDFELVASRTVIQCVSVGLSHLIGGVLSHQPWETNRIRDKL